MSERSILFSAPMVRAIRDDSKTQTRRIVKPQPPRVMPPPQRHEFSIGGHDYRCPCGQPGDRLIVKEAAWVWCRKEQDGLTRTGRPKFRYISLGRFVHYQATEEKPTYRVNSAPDQGWRLKIGRYLPRWASRITLEVAGVRVERLQDISEEDAYAEGVLACDGLIDEADIARAAKLCRVAIDDARALFFALFATIYGWELLSLNPWVWVVEFRRLP